MDSKKIVKIIIVNILLIFCILILAELYFYYRTSRQIKFAGGNKHISYINSQYDILETFWKSHFESYKQEFQSQKDPILLLGCSYAYGLFLNPEDYPSELLKNMTNRWVYNFAVPGADPMYNLLTLKQEEINPRIKDHKPKTIIYVYMFHQLRRLSDWKYYNAYRKLGYIESQPYNFLYNIYFYQFFKNRQLENILWKDKDYKIHLELLNKIMSDTKKITDELYPNSKFIFLIYSDNNVQSEHLGSVSYDEERLKNLFNTMYSTELKNILRNLDIQVISTKDLTKRIMGQNDTSSLDLTRSHPSKKAWEEILPLFIKAMGL